MFDRFELFATTIPQINRCIQKIKSHEMAGLGLKGTHVMCLYILGKEPNGLTAAQLCIKCSEDKAAISRTVSELTDRGFICSEAQPEDKRAYRTRLLLTEKGTEALEYMNDRVQNALDICGGGLSDAQRDNLYSSLTLIAENMNTYLEKENI